VKTTTFLSALRAVCSQYSAFVFQVLIAALALIHGNPIRLLNGYDSFGNICGYKKNSRMGDLPLSGIDTSDKK